MPAELAAAVAPATQTHPSVAAGQPSPAKVVRAQSAAPTGAIKLEGQVLPGSGRTASAVGGTVEIPIRAARIGASFNRTDGRYDPLSYVRRRDPAAGEEVSRRERDGEQTSVGLRVEAPLQEGVLKLSSSHVWEGRSSSEASMSGAPPAFSDSQRIESAAYRGSYAGPDEGPLQIEAQGSLQLRGTDSSAWYASGGTSRSYTRSDKSGEGVAIVSARLEIAPDLKLNAGVEAGRRWLESESSSNPAGASANEDRLEGFLGLAGTFGKSVEVEAALRGERSEIEGGRSGRFSFASPSVRAVWKLSPRRKIRLSHERNVGAVSLGSYLVSPPPGEDPADLVSPALRPTDTWRTELRAEQQFSTGASITLGGGRERLASVLDWIAVPGPSGLIAVYGDLGAAERRFAEIGSKIPLNFERGGTAELRFGLRAFDTEATDPLTGEARELSGQARLDWNAQAVHDLAALDAKWGFSIQGGSARRSYRINGRDIWNVDPVATVFVEYAASPETSLRLEVKNPLDQVSRQTSEHLAALEGGALPAQVVFREEKVPASLRLTVTRSFRP